MPQERTQLVKPRQEPEVPADTEAIVKAVPKPDMSDYDDVLDEIDDILEENAQQFVADYVQAGGE